MEKSKTGACLLIVLMMSLAPGFGCAKHQPQVIADTRMGTEKRIDMQASSFEFKPNNLRAVQGDTLVLNITNVADSGHNFTIKDPQGATLRSVDLPPKKTTTITVTLTQTGTYGFDCNKPLHATFGMKGQVQAVPRPGG